MAMKIFDIVKLALLNLYRRLSRTLLTVIGVVIGTACIVIMISIGLTNLSQFDEMLENTELTKIEVYTIGDSSLNQTRLDNAAVQAFSNIDHVNAVVPQMRMSMYAEVERYHAPFLNVIAVPADAMNELIEIGDGRNLSTNTAMPQIVMGIGTARYFIESEDDYRHDYKGPDIDWLNTPINLYLGSKYYMDNPDMPSSKKYKANVVGIIKDMESTEPERTYHNSEIYMSLDMAKKMIQENYKLSNEMNLKPNIYDSIFVFTDEMKSVSEVLTKIRSYGFEANSNTEWIEELQSQQKAQQGQLAAIGLISLIVSAIGIANTMMTGILERKKEIGVMKVIGVSINRIRTLFLIESALIGVIGGLAGILISHLFGYILVSGGTETNFLGMYFRAGMKLVMPFWLDISAIAIAIFVGVVAGLFPARRATKMSPLEAIRG